MFKKIVNLEIYFLLTSFVISISNSQSYNAPTTNELLTEVEDVPLAESSLILAHVIFRHGERSPTKSSTYPNDPHKYASYWPLGTGELNKAGQLSSYKLGLQLRKRYDNFLGPTYYSDLLQPITSDKSRTHASLQCVLAGMFPPSEDEKFLADLSWRPIHYNVIPIPEDEILALFDKCVNYFNLTSSTTNQTVLDLYTYLSNHTGEKILNNTGVFLMKDAMWIETRFGKVQPEWVAKIYPEPMTSASYLWYYDIIEQRLRLGAGGLFRKITKDTLNKLDGSLKPPRRKLFLYSGHEQTMVYALGALDAYTGQVPVFSSYLVFELHYINGSFGFKVFYQNYEEDAPVPINLFKQGEFCSVDVFLEKTEWLTIDPKPECP